MNSRERIRKAMSHQQADKVPLDLGGNQSSIHKRAYIKLLDYLGIEDPDIKYADFVQQIVVPCDEVLKRFQIDTRYIRANASMVNIKDYDPVQEQGYIGVYDQFGAFWGNDASKNEEEHLYYDPVIFPLKDMKTVEEINNHPWPDGNDPAIFEGLRAIAEELHENTGYALITPPSGCIYEYTTFLFGFTKAMRHLRKNPELIAATMGHLLTYWKNYNRNMLGEVGDYLDVLCINGDLAQQEGPIMSLKVYESLIKPVETELVSYIKSLRTVPINYHCCGSTTEFIPHWVEMGYDAYNPVQISAFDMEPCSLNTRFGEDITFWGGLCDSQNTLPFGTPESIRAEVKRNFECFKRSGGYIAGNIHNITAEVPPENIVAMFDAAIEFRDY